jgi:hypothetical protein
MKPPLRTLFQHALAWVYLPLLRAKLPGDPGQDPGHQLLRVLRAAGYQGGRRTMKRTLRRLRKELAHEHRRQTACSSSRSRFLAKVL